MNRETYAGTGYGRAHQFDTPAKIQADPRKVLELDGDQLEYLRMVLSERGGLRYPPHINSLRDFLEGAQRVRLEVDPRGSATLGNGFTHSFPVDAADGEQP